MCFQIFTQLTKYSYTFAYWKTNSLVYNPTVTVKELKMDIEEIEQKQKIKMKLKMDYMQAFFFKSFLVSFVFLLFATIMCMMMHDFQLAFVHKYFEMETDDFNYLVVLILGIWKILIFQFTLVPALVIWCMRKCCKHGCEK